VWHDTWLADDSATLEGRWGPHDSEIMPRENSSRRPAASAGQPNCSMHARRNSTRYHAAGYFATRNDATRKHREHECGRWRRELELQKDSRRDRRKPQYPRASGHGKLPKPRAHARSRRADENHRRPDRITRAAKDSRTELDAAAREEFCLAHGRRFLSSASDSRRHKARRKLARWSRAWAAEQIETRLRFVESYRLGFRDSVGAQNGGPTELGYSSNASRIATVRLRLRPLRTTSNQTSATSSSS
jgi:hypothetical protein